MLLRMMFVLSVLMTVSLAQAAPIQICLDKNPNPPFVYSEKIKGVGQLRGYSLELIKKVMAATATPYSIKSLSQSEIVQKMQSKSPSAGCDLVLDVLKTPDHESYMVLSAPIYQLNYELMYNWESYMTGLGVKTLAEVNKFKVCGLKSADYGAVSKTLKIHDFNSIKDVMFNIKTKECDVFVAESVAMRYGQRANQYQVPAVGCIRLAGTEKSYHIGIAKHVMDGAALITRIQQALNTTVAKELAALAEEYDITATQCQQTLKLN